jgi:hypothetical protein
MIVDACQAMGSRVERRRALGIKLERLAVKV